jgi:hypothetical protein
MQTGSPGFSRWNACLGSSILPAVGCIQCTMLLGADAQKRVPTNKLEEEAVGCIQCTILLGANAPQRIPPLKSRLTPAP